ncbi:tryptophan transporter [Filibacter tadaridae]|uniref:Putative tryptophan transport protein n=1 Tax=Filibacter tadaridae TaxID=2483811 RepID=A0A3P5XBN6_9BACL|nr:tryptophan transporter [Filibacter tadaridae]VDC25887.1 putative tryptophan transport protein [Filibacter tadaridae]
MKTKNLVLMALLTAVGAALYLIIPGYNGGMKPDFMLTMMFIGIFLFPEVKNVFLLAGTTGILSGIFSSFPGGFLPNIIDKFVTAFVIYAILLLLKKASIHLVGATVLAGLGTILSGSIFLSIAIFVLGVDLPFMGLFLTVVLPAVAMNGVAFFIIYPIVINLVKRSSFTTAVSN